MDRTDFITGMLAMQRLYNHALGRDILRRLRRDAVEARAE